MWPFNSKTQLAESALFDGFADCHCHILPGVDDGVRTMEESLAVLSHYERLGVREVWLTPHIMEDCPNATSALRQRFAELTDAYSGAIALHLSAENMLDSLFRERLRDGDLLPWGKCGDRLLVETSFVHAPANFLSLLGDIKSKGFFPVLAHPERYLYMTPQRYRQLKAEGTEFQLNLLSLMGAYGRHAKANAQLLLREGLYDYVATDLHSHKMLESALQMKLSRKELTKILGISRSATARKILLTN